MPNVAANLLGYGAVLGWRRSMKHRKSFRMKLLSLVTSALLLCGFGWDWTVRFAASVLFPVEEAIDTQLVIGFGSGQKAKIKVK